MAEITQNENDNSGGKVRSRKMSTKIDMTPMVDLAFLLLTFFILTTTFNDDYILRIEMPDKAISDPPETNEKNVMNLVLSDDNKLYWWIGINSSPQQISFGPQGLRKLLLERRAANPRLIVLVKPSDDSAYERLIDIIDELSITKMPLYTIVKYTDEDRMKIANR